MRKYLYVLFFLLYSCNNDTINNSKQILINNLNYEISQAEMYQDFDYLANYIYTNNIRINTKLILYNYNIMKNINDLRTNIQLIKYKKDFILLIKKVLMILQEKHSQICPNRISGMNLTQTEKNELTKINMKYYFLYNEMFKHKHFVLPILYYCGKYIFYRTITNEKMIIPSGVEVQKINGIPIDQYTLTLFNQKDLYWDKNNNKFYCETFYISEAVFIKTNFSLLFSYKEKFYQTEFSINKTVFNLKKQKENNSAFIHYFPTEKLLYIRVPSLKSKEFYENEIPQYKEFKINKVVIDIRENQGGEIWVAYKILNLLIDKDMIFKFKSIYKIFALDKSYFNGDTISTTKLDYFEGFIKIFYNQSFQIINITNGVILQSSLIIHPDKKSLNYKGFIYILQDRDIYSSANNFSQMALQQDKLVTVGSPSELDQGGFGFGQPAVIYLTNSKIVCTVVGSFDITHVTDTISMYHNEVEEYVPYTWTELVYRETNKANLYNPEYLLNHDSLIKYVLSIK